MNSLKRYLCFIFLLSYFLRLFLEVFRVSYWIMLTSAEVTALKYHLVPVMLLRHRGCCDVEKKVRRT